MTNPPKRYTLSIPLSAFQSSPMCKTVYRDILQPFYTCQFRRKGNRWHFTVNRNVFPDALTERDQAFWDNPNSSTLNHLFTIHGAWCILPQAKGATP